MLQLKCHLCWSNSSSQTNHSSDKGRRGSCLSELAVCLPVGNDFPPSGCVWIQRGWWFFLLCSQLHLPLKNPRVHWCFLSWRSALSSECSWLRVHCYRFFWWLPKTRWPERQKKLAEISQRLNSKDKHLHEIQYHSSDPPLLFLDFTVLQGLNGLRSVHPDRLILDTWRCWWWL